MMREEINSFYNYLYDLSGIERSDFDLAINHMVVSSISKGDYFLREGARSTKIAFVYQGIFKVFYTKDGQEVNSCFCAENDISASFESLISQTPSIESIQAVEDAVVVSISYSAIQQLYNISSAWQNVGRKLTEKECLRLSSRTNSLSFETAIEKYKSLLTQQPSFVKRIPVQDLASYLGVSRETLSRIRAKIAAE